MPGQFSPIEVNFGTRTTGTGIAHRPEILFLVESIELRFGDADLVAPDVVGLVVIPKNGDHQVLGLEAGLFGQKRPGMLDGLFLEIVTKREVAKHLE